MVSSSCSSKILIGISLDPNESKDLLSWAITLLAHPNDAIVAVHILVGKERKKCQVSTEFQLRLRRAKAFVISVLGEFARTCQFKQVNLEARVGFSSKVGRGLIKEANSVSADYLIIGGSRSRSNRPTSIARYCLRNSPNGCTLVVFGKCMLPQQSSDSDSAHSKESVKPSSWWTKSNTAISPAKKSESKSKNSSPRTVLDEIEVEYQSTEDETLSCGDSSITDSTSVTPNFTKKSKQSKQSFSPCRLMFSFIGSSFRRRNSKKEIKKPLLKCFNYEEIMNATNNFNPDNIVGRGGYSEVYRGDLSNGQTIAVKRLAKDNKDAKKEKEFLMELGIIGHVCHPNTASLVGCCIENGLYLIFNFSQNGTLASALYGNEDTTLDWPIRYKIAIGVARGLHYLHKCCKHRIIHRDIKASNVLLGPDYEPQITDFGLAKWLPNKWTHHAVIPIEGTFGYLAPEYFMHGIVDEKTDVFAFGVLLMEIVTGRRPVDSSKRNLLVWAKPLMESGDIANLADPMMEGKYDSEQLHRLVLTASYCIRQSSIWRPSMNEVLELLTNGHDSEVVRSWRIPKFTSDELDDYSMVNGYQVPTDEILEDSLSLTM
ncbi:probable receptor-like serine/threonine-protein kinase At5g57670 isoform X2 [Humulus lupulus]|uniref:probable receptor-like serine/threonine-protein kinase At5g57670 isoform X2 n=1 Tax=Humulus lupulus TaxID=3486 RepID=UPI002B4102F4|nr:probable receptor-like serine/threonine-protein kinase At5g57670 isoform X2 [Humulus lupulus]